MKLGELFEALLRYRNRKMNCIARGTEGHAVERRRKNRGARIFLRLHLDHAGKEAYHVGQRVRVLGRAGGGLERCLNHLAEADAAARLRNRPKGLRLWTCFIEHVLRKGSALAERDEPGVVIG